MIRGIKEYDDGILWNTWTHDKWESLTTTRMWLSASGHLNKCASPLIGERPEIIVGTDYDNDPSSSRDYDSSSSDSMSSSSRTDMGTK